MSNQYAIINYIYSNSKPIFCKKQNIRNNFIYYKYINGLK